MSSCTLVKHGLYAELSFGSSAQNALSSDLLHQIINHIQHLDRDEQIKLILIKSLGDRTFCAGANLDELVQLNSEAAATEFFGLFGKLMMAIRQSPHVIISKVQGKVVGGGLGILAVSDYVIASDHAQIRLSELINGIGPFVIGPALVRKMGLSTFSHLTLNPATWFTANYALEHGLYNEVIPSSESMDERIQSKINELAGYSRPALREIKKIMWDDLDYWEDVLNDRAGISGRLILTNEAKAALKKLKG